MTTWNDDVTHYIRYQGGPIDTRLRFKLEGDFQFVELPKQNPDDAIEERRCELILGEGDCTAHVWVPETIGSGNMTPTAAFFDKNGQYTGNFNCAMPAEEDGQPQSRQARDEGRRWLDGYPLNVQGLHNQRGDAEYFILTFLSIPYFYKELVQIHFSGAIRDFLPMYFVKRGERYLVTKIRFPEIEETEQPSAPKQPVTNLFGNASLISMTSQNEASRQIKLGR